MRSASNLKIIGIELHVYHGKHGHFPPRAVFSSDGKPLLSWRVLILPHLNEEDLYNRFKLDEPWDSPHNYSLLKEMPKTFEAPGVEAEAGYTYYQAFVGPGTCFEENGLHAAEIKDGTSHTIIAAEAREPVPWTKPEDLNFRIDGPLPALGGVFRGRTSWYQDVNKAVGFMILFADGHVEFFDSEDGIDETRLRALITRAGGENE